MITTVRARETRNWGWEVGRDAPSKSVAGLKGSPRADISGSLVGSYQGQQCHQYAKHRGLSSKNWQNYHPSIVLAHTPSVTLAWEEAGELEIVNTLQQTWPWWSCKNKRAACWPGNHLRAETTEAGVWTVSAWDVWLALGLFGRPWENSSTDKLSTFAIQNLYKTNSSL